MAKNDQYHEPDNHIAVELMYMAKLCEMTGEEVKSDKERNLRYLGLQREFLETHLSQWVSFFHRISLRPGARHFTRPWPIS